MAKTRANNPDVLRKLPAALASIEASFKDMDIPSLLAFRVDDDSCHVMPLGPEEVNGRLYLARLFLSENLDTFLKALMAHACEHGHDSLVLKAMGIAEKPTKP